MIAVDEESAIAEAQAADERPERLLVFGGGSNLVVADDGVPVRALKVASRGVQKTRPRHGFVDLEVAAGEVWDEFVEMTVATRLSGVEALSGIPGSAGGTPIQNVGAYGQAVGQTIRAVRAYDRRQGRALALSRAQCRFGYRRSVFQVDPQRFVVLSVIFRLKESGLSRPLEHDELVKALGVRKGSLVPLETVLQLRRSKGMVLDEDDHDTWSVGSFFKTAILDASGFAGLQRRAQALLGPDVEIPSSTSRRGTSVPAGWLVENAGFYKGYPLDTAPDAGVSVSTKHALALTNRGAGTTQDLVRLAREVAAGVNGTFGVRLDPEPVFIGLVWTPPD